MSRSGARRDAQEEHPVPVGTATGSFEEAGTTRTTSLSLKTRTGPFKDPAPRAAARTAIDSSALGKGVFEGCADPGAGVFGPAVT
ncbi:hypothetical protein AB0D62_02770 [Streptomyces massasporeus]|uniref:hypothetical protein n=1 Tax=Streptomyces massasporeus TaxID=67324 RepID=UPI0033C2CA69